MKLSDEQLVHANAAVTAKQYYWDALRAFEKSTATKGTEWDDDTNDKVIDALDLLATGYGPPSSEVLQATFGPIFPEL